MELRTCNKCKVSKAIDQFSLKGSNRRTMCKACHTAYRRNHYLENLEKYKEKARRWEREHPEAVFINELKKYGLTPEEYNAMVLIQDNKCKICNKPSERGRLRVDHCHKTGKIRGLLCSQCNLALGNIKEDRQAVLNLLKYIDSFNTSLV